MRKIKLASIQFEQNINKTKDTHYFFFFFKKKTFKLNRLSR
jgi:hypothetical protein